MENKNIYILEASAYHWAKDEHISLLEQKQWIGYGDIGKDKLEKTMKQIAKLWQTATQMYNKNHDGLTKDWVGRVWLNPPYSRPLIERFVKRLAEHGNGIALLFNRCDSKMFQDVIFEKATAMKFLRNRIRFFRPDGTRGDSPGCGSILIAFGEDNADILRTCNIAGKYVRIN